ncbi:MAG: hypothetical protein AAF604_09860 [Acidobacteriota bacterium]
MQHFKALLLAGTLALVVATPSVADISRDPNGVNVSSQGATTVFITFGNLQNQVPVEATWCGELIPAAPDLGLRCDPATVFGRLPIRFDQSRLAGSAFTDIMSIPPSVARRAYQAAAAGETSSFFYVRRFVSTVGGPDEYVFVTCRLAGGGARVPLALLDVQLRFASDLPVVSVLTGDLPPQLEAEISYNGTGRLEGRWEVVLPGDDPPTSRDLLTEASLPIEERPLQRRYLEIGRFNEFLPPTGRVVLPGPDPQLLPTEVEGLHQVLLRIEASDDKEGDSNLAAAGAGQGVVHSGAVAGFPLPALRYFVGSAPTGWAASAGNGLELIAPPQDSEVAATELIFRWHLARDAVVYRLEIETAAGGALHSALLQQGIGSYQAPTFVAAAAADKELRWRVLALLPEDRELGRTDWRGLRLAAPEESDSP